MCTVVLPPGVNPIAVNKYIITDRNFVKDKESTKKVKLGKRKGKGAAKYSDSKTIFPERELVIKVCYPAVAYPGIFFGGVQQIQLNGDLGAVAP